MAELTIEEKAKAYDEAKARMSRAFNSNRCTIGFMNEIFPELKESEDEKIRKALVDYFTAYKEQKECGIKTFYGIPTDNIIAYLEKQGKQESVTCPICGWKIEKQGEQKPVEVEPKFKVGNWVVNNHGEPKFYHVTSRSFPDSKIKGAEDKFETLVNTATLDKQFHLWTIEDAKDGDILVHSSFMFGDFIFIYNNTSILQAYCYYSSGRNMFIIEDRGHYCPWNMQEVKPSTKEQRDTLFAKMKEAGYEWDSKNKELKSIKQKSTDAKICEALISVLKSDFDKDATIFDISVGDIITWLNKKLQSLNSQSTWKPSDEHMEFLAAAVEESNENAVLKSLYRDLKKLREE